MARKERKQLETDYIVNKGEVPYHTLAKYLSIISAHFLSLCPFIRPAHRSSGGSFLRKERKRKEGSWNFYKYDMYMEIFHLSHPLTRGTFYNTGIIIYIYSFFTIKLIFFLFLSHFLSFGWFSSFQIELDWTRQDQILRAYYTTLHYTIFCYSIIHTTNTKTPNHNQPSILDHHHHHHYHYLNPSNQAQKTPPTSPSPPSKEF